MRMAITLQRIAQQLSRTPRAIERESMRAYLERMLLDTEADLLRIGQRYGVTTVRAFDRAVHTGRIRETEASRDDFFAMDHLTATRARIRALLRML